MAKVEPAALRGGWGVVWVNENPITIARTTVTEDEPPHSEVSVGIRFELCHETVPRQNCVVAGATGVSNIHLKEPIK